MYVCVCIFIYIYIYIYIRTNIHSRAQVVAQRRSETEEPNVATVLGVGDVFGVSSFLTGASPSDCLSLSVFFDCLSTCLS